MNNKRLRIFLYCPKPPQFQSHYTYMRLYVHFNTHELEFDNSQIIVKNQLIGKIIMTEILFAFQFTI